MSNLFETVSDLWADLRSGKVALPRAVTIPPERCGSREAVSTIIRRNQMYFTVRINQMYLAENRQWWSVYDPLVVVVTEFVHGLQRITIPTVIGPNLIRKQKTADRPRHGVVLLNTRVTGPHPYRGGDVDISIAFYQVERVNHAQALLNVIDSLSSSIGVPGEISMIAKAAAPLLQGVEGLLSMKETNFLAGQRISLGTPPDPFTAGFSALITPPIPDLKQLFVDDRELCS